MTNIDSKGSPPRGQGDGGPGCATKPLVGDWDFRRRKDVKMLTDAIRGGWAVPADRRAALLSALDSALSDPACPARAAIASARAVVLMHRANQDDLPPRRERRRNGRPGWRVRRATR